MIRNMNFDLGRLSSRNGESVCLMLDESFAQSRIFGAKKTDGQIRDNPVPSVLF